MVRPDNKADAANRDHRISHTQITENRLFRESRNNLGDHAKARQDKNVNFRMREEPEQMLVHNRITTACRVEESGSEITVCQQHGDSTGEYRQRQKQQENRDQNRPDEKRHFVQGHARRTHIENRRDEVNGAENG